MTAPRVLLADGTRRLTGAGTASPAAEARTLLAHVLAVDLGRLVLVGDVNDEQRSAYGLAIERRAAGEPVQHITGVAHFRSISVEVGPGVFVPRPETESMVQFALDQLRVLAEPVVVELCAGSGAISKAIAAEHPGQPRIHAVELSEDAAAYAARNLAGTGVDLVVGDMRDAFHDLDGTVDLVIANPPYIPLEAWESVPRDVRDHDPHLALFSGDDGLDATRVVAETASRLLHEGGILLGEHADVQGESAPEVFVRQGDFTAIQDLPDLTGRPRFVVAHRVPRR